jgi:hypothetical protein
MKQLSQHWQPKASQKSDTFVEAAQFRQDSIKDL